MKRRVAMAPLVLFVHVAIASAQVQVTPPLPPSSNGEVPNFTVGDIHVEGLQRVSEGTVFNYLPVNIGDTITPQRVREAIRALYDTGFFRDVQMRRDGNTLIVVVLERPSIESFEIKGNKDIKTEDLQKSLRNVGLATGKTFDRSVLEDVKQYLTDQYFSRGKYAVKIDATVEEEPGNRVKLKIDVKEGKRAKIRQINLVGTNKFKDKDILDDFELKTPNWTSWYKQNDRYSRESLQGDLEKLRSYYMDRGYANFQVESTQVAIAPDKDDIYITVNLQEGEVFKINDVKMAGTFPVPEEELRKYVLVKPGQIFSRKLITQTQEMIQNRLGQDGYAFAKVDPVPTTNNETHEVGVTFFVEPGNRVYVRNINFAGSNRINDEVMRRELRQLEGGWLSNVALDRSKQRIQRLPYVKKVDDETVPVPGSADLVDINFNVEEGPSAQLGGGIGYSESQSFILNGNYADSNFMGTGKRVAVNLQGGRYAKVYQIQQTNPYTTIDGLSRTFSLVYNDVTQFVSASSDFSSKTATAGLDFSYPITEFQYLRAGFALQDVQLLTTALGSAVQAQQWVQQNGHPFKRTGVAQTLSANGTIVDQNYDFYGSKFANAELSVGWIYDSRNRTLFPDKGTRVIASATYTPPGSAVEYWIGRLEYLRLQPLWGKFALSFDAAVNYGGALGDTTSLPPFKNFFGGGPDSIRGFRESRMGPKDQFGNPYGGNMLVYARSELLIPIPEKWQTSARVSAFYDIGNVFYQGKNTVFTDKGGFPVDYSFSLSEMKSSVGLSVQWLAPLGLFRFSYGVPLKYRRTTELDYGDELEQFQFSIGQAF